MRAAFLDFATLGDDVSDQPLAEAVDALTVYAETAPDQVIARCREQDAVFTNKCRFDADTLRALPSLRYIGLTATGSDGIDLQAAADNGVAVSNITAYCTQSVVQHVFAVLLALTHRIGDYHNLVMSGRWQRNDTFCMLDFPIRELRGMTLGIVGYGELGRAVASVAPAFGMRVRVAEREGQPLREGRIALADLWREADVVSLHCPLSEETRHLINATTLAQMKPGAVLINTARGGLVDAVALADALRNGRLGAAAIDVLEQEPPPAGHPLIDLDIPNLLLTPHTAWAAREARQRAIEQTADNFRRFLAGERHNRVEPDKGSS